VGPLESPEIEARWCEPSERVELDEIHVYDGFSTASKLICRVELPLHSYIWKYGERGIGECPPLTASETYRINVFGAAGGSRETVSVQFSDAKWRVVSPSRCE
jgi:hypothetical protein